ncbi:SR-related and CTD-associated factor 4 isoform X2 [Centruroides vittatus]|uniref:SR-related and CTD-associated factor 4 isoform X2 n=1 Tax=Centruroides vittatus TaxID=120091 RepID=UPI00350FBF2D
MEVVRAFNNELSSLYECKPPISKAKMTQVTKAAIKGIKFYKHIVQSVEKFVQKCRAEYKVPGLYVIDSIVRQSRHQFGCEKDVFAPRFTKNITATFQNLFKCPFEDRPKIVRVLNLWQKNNVFPSEVIQPLLDMANPNAPVFQQTPPSGNENSGSISVKHKGMDSAPWKTWSQNNQHSDGALTESHSFQNSEEPIGSEVNKIKNEDSGTHLQVDTVLLTRLQEIAGQLLVTKTEETRAEESTVKFNKKLLDFDYSDDEEEEDEEEKQDDGDINAEPNELALSMAQNLLSNPELLRQLQQMQQTIQQTEALKSEISSQEQLQQQHLKREEYSQPLIEDSSMSMQSIPFPEEQPPEPMMPPYSNNAVMFTSHQPSTPITDDVDSMPSQDVYRNSIMEGNERCQMSAAPDVDERFGVGLEHPLSLQDMDLRPKLSADVKDDREMGKLHRSRSRSGSRSRTRSSRKHSHRSRSRSPRRKRSRSRSGSRSRSRHKRERYSRSRSRERERERERDRRRRGLPPIKKNHVGVCSTTLWLGHVPKTVSEVDLQETFGEFGVVRSIDMILPRGCAFVCMEKRQDANRALQKLRNLKLQGCNIKMAWAPGKGVKEKEYKSYWDVEFGVSYIPFEKLPSETELSVLEEGSMIDEDSLPEKYREYRKQKEKEKVAYETAKHMNNPLPNSQDGIKTEGTSTITSNVSSSIASTMSVPIMVPPMVQTQYGIPMPGLMHHQHMVMPPPVPMGVPPPNPMLMVPPTSQPILGAPLPVIPPIPSGPMNMPPGVPGPHVPTSTAAVPNSVAASSADTSNQPAGDATPTEEDGTSNIVTTSTVQTSIPAAVPSTLPPLGTLPSLGQPPYGSSMGMQHPMPHSTANPPPFPPPGGVNFPPSNRHMLQSPQTMGATPPNWKPNSSFLGDNDLRYSVPPSGAVSQNMASAGAAPSRPPSNFAAGNPDGRLVPPTPAPGNHSTNPPGDAAGSKFGNQDQSSGHQNFSAVHGPGPGARNPHINMNRPPMNPPMPHPDNMSADPLRGPEARRDVRGNSQDAFVNKHQEMLPRMVGSQEAPRPFLPPRAHGPPPGIPMEDPGLRARGPIFPGPRNFGPRGLPQMHMRNMGPDSVRGPGPMGPMRPRFLHGPRGMGPRGIGLRPELEFAGHPRGENPRNFGPPPRRWNGPGPGQGPGPGPFPEMDRHGPPPPDFHGRREFFEGPPPPFGRGQFKGRGRKNWNRDMEGGHPPNRRFGGEPWPREERDWHRIRDEIYFGHPDDREQQEEGAEEEPEFFGERHRFPSQDRNFGDEAERNGCPRNAAEEESTGKGAPQQQQQEEESSPAPQPEPQEREEPSKDAEITIDQTTNGGSKDEGCAENSADAPADAEKDC